MISSMLIGAFIMASFVVSLFFFRYWKTTKDCFFLLFALSFVLEASSRLIIAFTNIQEQKPLIYLLRMLAYLLIIWAIYDKNKRFNHKISGS